MFQNGPMLRVSCMLAGINNAFSNALSSSGPYKVVKLLNYFRFVSCYCSFKMQKCNAY